MQQLSVANMSVRNRLSMSSQLFPFPCLFWEEPVEPVGCNLARVMHLQFHAGFAAF